ncbi:MAG: methyltransferase domain-containing protein [Mahellales bacterium]|jgi:23S rRNA (guanine745-N1)-methyltransferase
MLQNNNREVKIRENIDILKCPVCGAGMDIDGMKSVVCQNRHCFDISRRGYVNLLLNAGKSQYDKEMFESRNIICKMGFFEPLLKSMVCMIDQNAAVTCSGLIRVLDAGCGEGFHLSRIMEYLDKRDNVDFHGVGIDITKEAIQIASKNYKNILWCVADLARIPFKDRQFDIILNILSPSNYREFNRILTDDGILIKVVPGSDYLKELREAFYQQTEKEAYSNLRVIDHFSRNFYLMNTDKVRYNVKINQEQLRHLIKMTPLSWGAEDKKVKGTLKSGIDCVTVEFTVMTGKKKG